MEEYLNNIPDCLKPMSFSRNMIEDLTLFIIRHKKIIGWLTVTLPNKEEFCIENIYILKYLQPIITQYFIDNKSEIWLLFLIAHSKR